MSEQSLTMWETQVEKEGRKHSGLKNVGEGTEFHTIRWVSQKMGDFQISNWCPILLLPIKFLEYLSQTDAFSILHSGHGSVDKMVKGRKEEKQQEARKNKNGLIKSES